MRSEEEIREVLEGLLKPPKERAPKGMEAKHALVRVEQLSRAFALEWVLGERDDL